MYGGGELDGNADFSGGGFMPSQATTQSHDSSSSFKAITQAHDSSSSFKNRTLLPLTLKQLNSVSTNGESTFSIDGVDINTVAIVGQVSSMENKITQVDFVVDDGTGCVECVRWCHERQEAEEMEAVKLGMCVRLHGHLKCFQGKRSVNVFSIRPVTDFNEIVHHFADCIYVHMYITKSQQLENAITEILEENNNKIRLTSYAEANPVVASSSINREVSSSNSFIIKYCFRDGMMYEETIPDRAIALKNLPNNFLNAYNKLAVNKVQSFLEHWVWQEAKISDRIGNFYLADDGTFSHLCWNTQKLVVSRKLMRMTWEKHTGPVRCQQRHVICWCYAGSDLVSAKRVIRGWEDEYVPLCTWFMSYFAPNEDPERRLGHRCFTNYLEEGLKFIQSEGIPKEIPGHEVFDCNLRPPSADEEKFKIKSVITIDTLEEALKELETQPMGASLVVFPDLLPPGKRIYYGPLKEKTKFLGFHSVVIVAVREMDEELVAVCKLSNGKTAADHGYAYVSLSVVYLVIAADPKEQDRHRATPTPQRLLSSFVYPEIDQAPARRGRGGPNPKRKNQDRGAGSKKPRL